MAENKSVKIPWDGWTVTGTLGRGAFGRVYRIERNLFGINEKAAMKVITIPKDPEMLEDLYSAGYDEQSVSEWCRNRRDDIQREYALMTNLKGHTNIVSCDDIAVESHTEDPGFDIYIRMELLTPLQKILKTKELSEKDIIRIGMDICRALTVCEKYRIIHRDIKPQNILVNDTGDYKLGDFGVARTMEHTTNATVAGTENYMAPEIIRRDKYGKDVDTYSLGLVLYWLLNKRTMPFLPVGAVPRTEELEEAWTRRVSGEPLPEPVTGSKELKAVVMKACRHDRTARYSSAEEMLKDLSMVSPGRSRKSSSDVMVRDIGAKGGAVYSAANLVPEQDGYNENEESTVGMFSWNNTPEDNAITVAETQGAPAPAVQPPGKRAVKSPEKREPKKNKNGEPKKNKNGEPKKDKSGEPKKDKNEAPKENRKTATFALDDLGDLLPYFIATALTIYLLASKVMGTEDPDMPILYGMVSFIAAGFLTLILPAIPYLSGILAALSGYLMGVLLPLLIILDVYPELLEKTTLYGILMFALSIFAIYPAVAMYRVFKERHS